MDGGLRTLSLDGRISAVGAKPGNPRALSAAGVMAIYEAFDGKIWVGTHAAAPTSSTRSPADQAASLRCGQRRDHVGERPHRVRRGRSREHVIGTQGGGLDLAAATAPCSRCFGTSRLNRRACRRTRCLRSPWMRNGRVWVATDGGGLEWSRGRRPTRRHPLRQRLTVGGAHERHGLRRSAGSRRPSLAQRQCGLMRLRSAHEDHQDFPCRAGRAGRGIRLRRGVAAARRTPLFRRPAGFNVFDPGKLTESTRRRTWR